MECIEAKALKSSIFYSQFPMKSSSSSSCPQGCCCFSSGEELWCGTATEDFSVDEFFDLPADEEEYGGCGSHEEEEEDEDLEKESCDGSFSSLFEMNFDDGYSNSSETAACGSHLSGEVLSFPVADDMKELELWSNLLDDSVPDSSSLSSYPLPQPGPTQPRSSPLPNLVHPFIPASFPVKPRTKLPKKSRLSPHPTLSASSTSSPSPNPVHPVRDLSSSMFYFPEPASKKQRRNNAAAAEEGGGVQRKCSHCLVQKTPQWRAGPMGPKTLCNACGVRFKKGRLYPEYRPACSPTFASGVHSNSHRKVLEMRKEKEMGLAGFKESWTGSRLVRG